MIAITVLGAKHRPHLQYPSLDGDLPSNAPVALSGTVFDPETLASLAISWNSDIYGPLGTSTVNADGSSRFLAVPQLSIGTHTVTLFAEDDANGTHKVKSLFAINTRTYTAKSVAQPSQSRYNCRYYGIPPVGVLMPMGTVPYLYA